MDVGLPDGQMGNSEVGHLNIGAGRIVYQELTRITKSIQDGDFFAIPEFVDACAKAKANGGKLHLIGLLSDGGVHSHITHLFALIDMAKRQGLGNVYVHCIMDGRDTPPSSGIEYVKQLQDYMDKIALAPSPPSPAASGPWTATRDGSACRSLRGHLLRRGRHGRLPHLRDGEQL